MSIARINQSKEGLLKLSGPLLTLLVLLFLEVTQRNLVKIPNPNAIFLTVVVYATFVGGVRVGLLSGGFTLLYVMYYFSRPEQLFSYSGEDALRIGVQSVTTPLTVFMVGWLKYKFDRQLKLAKDSELHYRLMFENNLDGVVVMSLDGKIIAANPAICELLGYTLAELLTLNRWQIIDLEDAAIEKMVQERLHSGSGKVDLQLKHKDGRQIACGVTSKVFKGDNGQIRAIVTIRDISFRVQAQQNLKNSEERYRSLIRNIPDAAVLLFDKELRYTLAEGPVLAQSGFSKEMMQGKTIGEVLPPESSAALAPLYQAVFAGESTSLERIYQGRYYAAQIAPVKNEQGEITGGVVFTQDITRQHQAEAARRQSEAILRSFYDSASMMLGLVELAGDDDIIHLSDNPASAGFFGRSAEAMKDQLASQLGVAEEIRLRWIGHYRESEKLGRPVRFEYPHLSAEGLVWLAATVSYIGQFVEGRARFSYIVEDITLRRQSETRFQAFMQHLPALAWVVDRQGRLTFVNETFSTLLGYTSRQATGQNIAELMPPAQAEEYLANNQKVFDSGQTLMTEETIIKFDGTLGTALSYKFLFDELDERGQPLLGGIALDITARRHAEEELKALNLRLEQSNRELQDFASVASHDLQEPLRKIVVFGERLKAEYGESLGEEGQDYLNRMQNAARRMQNLINDLLTFSRIATKARPFNPVNLNQVVQEVLSDLEIRLEQTGGQVEVAQLPVIEAEPIQMRQLFQNLLGNALKFRRKEVVPLIKIDGQILEERFCELRIEDNGIGFDEKYLDRIFGVFQRLHPKNSEYEGTGIGLAVCRKIAERHSGTINATSQPGNGATFIVTLPLVQRSSV